MHLQEAKQAVELMGKWETIDVCDALELLSPVFESEEVSGHHCIFCLNYGVVIQCMKPLHMALRSGSIWASCRSLLLSYSC